MQIAPINEQIRKPSNQICPLPGPKFIAEHLRQLCIHGKNLNGKCTQSFRKSQESSKPIKYQRNCVRNSLFYDSSISIEYTYTSTLPIRKRLHSLSLIFQLYDLVLCAQTSANVCCYCYCRVPATAVFVAVISFNNEC